MSSLIERTVTIAAGRRRWGWPLALVLGVLSFAIVSGLIGLVTDDTPRRWKISVLGQKLAHLRQHGGDYDTLFLGSSRVHYGLDPELFDAEMARQGCRSRSFNMGVQALTLPEEHRLVRELAAIGGWQRVIIERNPIPLKALDMLATDRGAFGFGTLHGVRLALTDIWTSPLHILEAGKSTAELLLVGAYEQLGIGRIARLIPRPGDDEMPTDGRIVDLGRRGFVPIERETDPVMRARIATIDWDRLNDYLRQTREIRDPPPRLGATRAELIRGQIEHARGIAPDVAYVVWPHSRPQWTEDARAIGQAAADGRLGPGPVVNLGDPALAPELFAEELWHDNLHLHTAGTELITRAVAAQLCAASGPD